MTPTRHGLPGVIQHVLILALQKLKQQSMPADRGMTWCSTPGSASELVLEADIRCWPRELWWWLVKPGHLNSLVGSLLSLSSWCRSLPDVWRAEWWVPCLLGSWRQILQVSQTLSTYPEEPWANHSRLSSFLMACHHLLSQSGPTCGALAHQRASGENIGSREESRMSNSNCNRRCLVPNQKSYGGPNTNTNTKFFP